MKFSTLIAVFIFCSVTNGQTHNCEVRFQFKKVCNRFLVDSECQPPLSTTKCKRLKTTLNDPRCPIYDCVSYKAKENIRF